MSAARRPPDFDPLTPAIIVGAALIAYGVAQLLHFLRDLVP